MPFTLIKGEFKPEFGRPDGDSLRFVPDDPTPIFSLRRPGREPKINANNGSIQLRYEAIDTMESSALRPFSSDATDSNIALATAGGGRGFICSRQLDPHGRPVVFVFAGDSPHADGADDVFLDTDDIMKSVNVAQLERGHAYPLYYDTLFDDLRERCTEVVLDAKADQRGVWAADKTIDGAAWTGDPDTLPPILPKLWRRIDDYVRDDTFFDPAQPMANLKAWIAHEEDERVSIPSQGIFTGFDNVVGVTGDTVKLLHEPHELVVISR